MRNSVLIIGCGFCNKVDADERRFAMADIVRLYPERPVFQKTIALEGWDEDEERAIVVSIAAEDRELPLITLEIKGGGGPTPTSEIFFSRDARAIAAALIRAADRADRLAERTFRALDRAARRTRSGRSERIGR
jgi:hypothetical protein